MVINLFLLIWLFGNACFIVVTSSTCFDDLIKYLGYKSDWHCVEDCV